MSVSKTNVFVVMEDKVYADFDYIEYQVPILAFNDKEKAQQFKDHLSSLVKKNERRIRACSTEYHRRNWDFANHQPKSTVGKKFKNRDEYLVFQRAFDEGLILRITTYLQAVESTLSKQEIKWLLKYWNVESFSVCNIKLGK